MDIGSILKMPSCSFSGQPRPTEKQGTSPGLSPILVEPPYQCILFSACFREEDLMPQINMNLCGTDRILVVMFDNF